MILSARARSLALAATVLTMLLAANMNLLAADAAGSSDYPDIGRFAESEISSYDVENYGQTVYATGPVKKASDAETTALEVEGRITRIVYRVPPGISALEVFRNFEARVADAGFAPVFSGGPGDIDAYTFKYKHPVEILDKISVSDEILYLMAKKSVGGADVYLGIMVSPHSGGDGQRVRLIATETKAMEMQMVDADQMQRSIAEAGRVALYGIYFDHDSASIKTESGPTLGEIGKLLASQPGLKIIVVGHTDYTGGYDYNMNLSKQRARSVAAALVSDYEISPDRLKSAGVGYLAPAASNETDAGRALNRRVELVKDK